MSRPLDVDECIRRTASAVAGRYRGFVSFDDLYMEGWVWALNHPDQLNKYKEHEAPALAAYWMSRDIWKKMDRYARDERARSLGYEPADEAFYGSAQIMNMLPHVLAGVPLKPITEKPEIHSAGDPAEGGDWLASYLDVKSAWDRTVLSKREDYAIRQCVGAGESRQLVGEALGVDYRTVDRCITSAVRKLSEALGGPRPSTCKPGCECHAEPLGSEPSESNDQEE
jgi:DNA-directed RNA polymerase specialized sigma24 family protein